MGNVGDLDLASSRSRTQTSAEGRKGGKSVGRRKGEGKMEKQSGEEKKDLVRNEPQVTLIECQMARQLEGSLGEGPSYSPPSWKPLGCLGVGFSSVQFSHSVVSDSL